MGDETRVWTVYDDGTGPKLYSAAARVTGKRVRFLEKSGLPFRCRSSLTRDEAFFSPGEAVARFVSDHRATAERLRAEALEHDEFADAARRLKYDRSSE